MASVKNMGAFTGTKKHLANTTVTKYIDTKGALQYCIFKGKGTGSQLTMTTDWNMVVAFDEAFKSLTYKIIFSKKDGSRGGAWFLNNEMFFPNEHPFVKEGGYTF